ncbi:DUF459 domain-containing protein [candidate division WOR-3 bacterium]|nr:DUF459 domain-containing protein [candidate division WOR-3 bacterium]
MNFIQPDITWQDALSLTKSKIKDSVFLLIGDSMIGGAVGFFLSGDLKSEGASDVIVDYHVSSGLSRPDFYNWDERLSELNAMYDFDYAFVFLGANDNQPLHRYGSGWIGYHTEEWFREYHSRVGSMMDALLRKAEKVYWIGLPRMASSEFDAGTKELNEIYEQEAKKRPRVIYISSYDLLEGKNQSFSELRTEDGCHLTSEGARLLVEKIMETIN